MSSIKSPLASDKDYTVAIAKGRSPSSVERADKSKQDGPVGNVGFASSSLNLIKTIMGTGMLVLPFAFQQMSIIPAVLLLTLAGIVSGLGLYLLTCASLRVSGGRNGDFASLAKATYPRLTPIFDLAVLLKCLGVAVGYFVVIGQISPKILSAVFTKVPWPLSTSVFWVILGAAIIGPVVYMPRMDSLKYTSFLGMLSIVYMVGLSMWLLIRPPVPIASSIPWWNPPGPLALIKNFGVFIFAFTCHQNMLPIQNEAKSNSQRSMLRIISLCISLALIMYISFATFNLVVFGASTVPGNIIMAYPKAGFPFVLARFLYFFLVLFSIPLQTFPARNSATKIITYYAPQFCTTNTKMIYYGLTTAIYLFSWGLACVGPDLEFLLTVVGSTAGPILCYILPSLFWFNLERHSLWGSVKVATLLLLVFGVAALIISTTALFL